MKNSIFLLFLAGLLMIISCEAPVVFTEPQPQGFEPQSSFDLFYRGTFLCESDSSIVHVKAKTIYKEKPMPFAMTLGEIDTVQNIYLQGNYLYVDELANPLPATIIGDSVYGELILRDTLFTIGKDQVLTRFKGHQLMNVKTEDEKWEVGILSLDYSFDLLLSITVLPEDLNRLEQITPVEDLSREDTIQFRISPTVYEFSQILDEELIFEACDYYKRLALEVEI